MLPGELAGQCFWFDCQVVHGVDHGVDALPQPIGLTHLSLKYIHLVPMTVNFSYLYVDLNDT